MENRPVLNSRQEILLVFLGAGGGQELDPIRIMKGLFVFGREAPQEWFPPEAHYEFEPYLYGPCSFQIYADLDQLVALGHAQHRRAPGRSWKYYSLTRKGARFAKRIARAMHPDAIKYLQAIREVMSTLSFRQLLTQIYRRYPEYAVNSVFKS